MEATMEKFRLKFISKWLQWLCAGGSWWKVIPCTCDINSRTLF